MLVLRARKPAKPRAAKPRPSIAQVEASGTASTEKVVGGDNVAVRVEFRHNSAARGNVDRHVLRRIVRVNAAVLADDIVAERQERVVVAAEGDFIPPGIGRQGEGHHGGPEIRAVVVARSFRREHVLGERQRNRRGPLGGDRRARRPPR